MDHGHRLQFRVAAVLPEELVSYAHNGRGIESSAQLRPYAAFVADAITYGAAEEMPEMSLVLFVAPVFDSVLQAGTPMNGSRVGLAGKRDLLSWREMANAEKRRPAKRRFQDDAIEQIFIVDLERAIDAEEASELRRPHHPCIRPAVIERPRDARIVDREKEPARGTVP